MSLASYISGYVDGEGCFSIHIRPRKNNRIGWEVVPSFSVGQHQNKAEVLYLMKDYFGCGYIRLSKRDNVLHYETRSIGDIRSKIIPHFRKHPLLSSRAQDFKRFEKICEMIDKKRHLTENGLLEIMTITEETQTSKRRIYKKEDIIRSLVR